MDFVRFGKTLIWWRRRDSNPRPQSTWRRRYKLSWQCYSATVAASPIARIETCVLSPRAASPRGTESCRGFGFHQDSTQHNRIKTEGRLGQTPDQESGELSRHRVGRRSAGTERDHVAFRSGSYACGAGLLRRVAPPAACTWASASSRQNQTRPHAPTIPNIATTVNKKSY